MTVKELMDKLAELPSGMRVVTGDDTRNPYFAESRVVETVELIPEPKGWDYPDGPEDHRGPREVLVYIR